MKVTKYFIGNHVKMSEIGTSIQSANTQKDNFIKDNIALIGDIDKEYLQVASFGQNTTLGIAIIQLTYFPKTQ